MLLSFDAARKHLHDKGVQGEMATDTAPAPSGRLGLESLHVADGVILDLPRYRDTVLTLPFQTVRVGPLAFHGIAPCENPTLADWITARYPHARPRMTFFRQSPAGQVEPNFIHTDRDMGDWSGILYLTAHPLVGDGTSFYRDRLTGATASTAQTAAELLEEGATWRDRERWQEWARVKAQPNRLVLFPATLFHSRAIFENYGTGDDARLIQLVFGTGSLDRGTP
jgi:hypothetical protein